MHCGKKQQRRSNQNTRRGNHRDGYGGTRTTTQFLKDLGGHLTNLKEVLARSQFKLFTRFQSTEQPQLSMQTYDCGPNLHYWERQYDPCNTRKVASPSCATDFPVSHKNSEVNMGLDNLPNSSRHQTGSMQNAPQRKVPNGTARSQ